MSKGRAWIFILLGLLLAVGSGALVWYTLQSSAGPSGSRAEQLTPEPVASMRLPVAARQLEVGTKITKADYIEKDFPLDLVPITAISQTVDLEGKTLIARVTQGETFHGEQFLGAKTGNVSDMVQKDHVVFAFPIVDLMSQSAIIHDGDRIDLLLTIAPAANPDGSQPQKSTITTVQNIEVLQVLTEAPANEDKAAAAKPTALLLSVKPEDAVLIKWVKDSGGVIDFALRSKLDQDQHQTPAITYNDIASRYGIR